MANAHNGNTLYIDSTGAVGPTKNVKIAYMTVSVTGASPVLILRDGSTTKFDLTFQASTVPQVFDFSEAPAYFPNGVTVNTITNCKATLITVHGDGGQGG